MNIPTGDRRHATGDTRQATGDARRVAGGEQAFTLVEVLIALVIVVTMGAVVAINVLDHPQKARQAAAKMQLSAFKTALELYAADNGFLPTRAQGLQALVAPPASDPVPRSYPPHGYLDAPEVPLDPWGRPYAYLVPGSSGEAFEIVSYGADGEEGGADYAADLSSSRL